jgi:uncharacterized membrane protein
MLNGKTGAAQTIARAAFIAALYAVTTWLVAPMAYGPLQFRVSEVLKPLALRGRVYVAGLAVGLALANLLSPMAGPWEWLVMPVACWLGGELCMRLGTRPTIATCVYALWIAGWVATMLHVVAGLPWLATWAWVAVPELLLMNVGCVGLGYLLRGTKVGRTGHTA